MDIQKYATRLHEARKNNQAIEKISEEIGSFSQMDAYAVQEVGMNLRFSEGEKLIGMKMGLTSKAKREQMNLKSALYGALTDKMQISGDDYELKNCIHPKIEPEIAFQLNQDLKGNVTRDEVLNACSGVCAAMEILDSRYIGFKYFSLEDVIADNSSSYMFVLSNEWHDPKVIDPANLEMTFKVNGEVNAKGNTNLISGDPVQSVIQLCELLEKRDQYIKAGSIVLAGAACPAVQLEKGQIIELEVQKLGSISLNIN